MFFCSFLYASWASFLARIRFLLNRWREGKSLMDNEILASKLEVYFDLCRWMGTCHCRGKIRYSDNCREGRGGLGWLQRKISQGEGGESNVCMYSVYSVLCNTIESYLQAYTLKPALSPPFPLFQFYFIVSPFLSFGAGLGGTSGVAWRAWIGSWLAWQRD